GRVRACSARFASERQALSAQSEAAVLSRSSAWPRCAPSWVAAWVTAERLTKPYSRPGGPGDRGADVRLQEPCWHRPPPLMVSFSALVGRGRHAAITVASTICPPIASQPLLRNIVSNRSNTP